MLTVVRFVLASCLVLTLGIAPVAAQNLRRTDSPLLSESSVNRLDLTRGWWGHSMVNRQRDRIAMVSADEFLVIAQSTSGIVSAFDAESGRLKWYTQVGASDTPTFPVTFNDDYLLFIQGNKMTGLSRDKGKQVFSLILPGQPNTPAVTDKNQVYLGCLDGSMYAYDLPQIVELQTQGKLKNFSDVAMRWRYRTSKPISTPAVLQGTQVIFSSLNGSVYSVAALNRKMAFQFETDAALSAPIVRYKELLILASEDYNVYAINALNGRLVWQFTTGLVIKQSPVIVENDLYVIPEYGSLYRCDAATGIRLWTRPSVKRLLACSGDRVYVVDQRDHIQVLSRQTGEPISSLSLKDFKVQVVNSTSDRIYMSTESGLMLCLHERDRDFPTFYRRPELQPISPPQAKPGQSVDNQAKESESSDEDAMPADGSDDEAPEAEIEE